MGDVNQLELVKRNADLVREPILEVGSKNYGSTPNFRSIFADRTYVGADMAPGKGVDVVVDFTESFDRVDEALGGRRFGAIICFSVLEHCKNPFKMSDSLSRLLDSGGTMLVSVPFCWKVHAYPSDYWRFTADGVRVLFPDVLFDDGRSSISTSKPGEILPIDQLMARADFGVAEAVARGDYHFLSGVLIRMARRLNLAPFLLDYPYLHPPVMVNMIGKKRTATASAVQTP